MATEVPNPSVRPAAQTASQGRTHYPLVDLLRGVSCLIIVLHHLTRYGPQSDHAMALVPSAIDAISSYGSLPVQIFLVISGFVGALSLERTWIDLPGFGGFLVKRYLRLGLPYLATIAYGLLLYLLIPARMATFALFDEISWSGMLAHFFFLQDIFGYPSLYAGFWYLAIDYQLNALVFALMLLNAGLVRTFRVQSSWGRLFTLLSLFLPLACASIFHWNLNSRYEIYALYFFGTIFLGIVAAWAIRGRVPGAIFWAYVVIVILGLIFEWRVRLAVALATAVAIYLSARFGWNRPLGSVFQWLSRISYSLFLTHYPTSWAVLGIGSTVSGTSPWGALGWMSISLALSLVAAETMYRLVEQPTQRLIESMVPK